MKQIFRIALSIGLSFVILALLMQALTSGLSDAERPSVLAALQGTTISLVFAYLALYLVTLVIRAYRYKLLITLSGETNVPTLRQMALVTGIRNMIVDMLPARIGELGYVGLLNRGYGVKLQHCASSLTISIAFDLVALLVVVLFILISQLVGAEVQGWALAAVVSALALSAIALIGLFVIAPWFSSWASKHFSGSVPEQSWRAKLLGLLSDFGDSLLAVRSAGRTTEVVVLSVVIRMLKYFGFYLLFRAVAAPSFETLAELPVEQVISALIGGELGASLPIPTFMSFGAYEAGSALVFKLLGIADQAAGLVAMLCVHIWSQVVEYLIGGALLAFFVLMNRRAGNLEAAAVSAGQANVGRIKKWAMLGIAGAVFVLGSGLLAWELRAAKKMGAINAPTAGQQVEALDERQLSQQAVAGLDGFVVFSSNRDGNHDIFKLNLSDFKLSKITDHPHTETYPRISPDGTRIVFARAHQEWVSQRNTVAWDVYLKDLKSGAETKVGSNGTSPHWLNNSEITYLQDATTVLKVSLSDLQSKIAFQAGLGNAMPVGSQLQNPKVNPVTEQVVFTGRQSQIGINSGHWGTAIASSTGHRGLFNGCEIAWTSDGKGLYQVTPGGRNNGLRIIKIDPVSFETSTLIDLEGEFSHEYWPKDSANGEYMVLGASRGPEDHEHDTKDYEIFLWKVGSDSGQATRLTFHTGNENWPDVFIR